jgi:hypothetical protein
MRDYKRRGNRWERGLRAEWRKGFVTGALLVLALFSYTISETVLAIVWWIAT